MSSVEIRANPFQPVHALEVPPRAKATLYPPPFGERMTGRVKRTLGDRFGLKNFGVNITTLEPGAQSSLKHQHSVQEEFIYVIDGEIVLMTDDLEFVLGRGMCCGFAASGGSHHLVNRSSEKASYLEIGDRQAGDEVYYPDDDIQVRPGPDGKRRYEHKNGEPY